MKKILLLLTILISSNVFADWVFVTYAPAPDNIDYYIDKSTIKKNKNIARVWAKLNYFEKDEFGDQSYRILYEINCKDELFTMLDASAFQEIDFKGKMTSITLNGLKPQHIPPNSTISEVMNVICK